MLYDKQTIHSLHVRQTSKEQQPPSTSGTLASASHTISTSGPAFTIGARLTSKSMMVAAGSESVPGPGQYDVPATTLSGPAFTLRGRVRDKVPENVPGPGQYGGGVSR